MSARDFRTRLSRRGAKAGIGIPDDLAERLAVYYELLERWNRKINLTALDDPDVAIDRLLLEPVIASRFLPTGSAIRLIDIGSGGGSPAVPLALAGWPRVALTMVEVKVRKSAFLREAIRQLQLSNASVENRRFEELLGRPELHEHFHAMSMRAVRVENTVLMTLQAFLQPGAALLMFRGPSGANQPEMIPLLEWATTVPLVESLRSRLTIARKVAAAPTEVFGT
ncbi:MAG: 16S rRNA (guanine(527)-N(7))-methyltransferase RsmG [Vicinamibacterales bacterium]